MKIRGNTIGTPIKPEKTIVKATGLSEEQKAQARENIGAVTEADVEDVVNSKLSNIINAEEVAY